MNEEILLVAASGLAKEVLSSLHCGRAYHVKGIVDDDPALCGTSILGVEVLGSLDVVPQMAHTRVLICAGSGQTRQRIVARLAASGVPDERYATVLDRSVHVPASCSVGAGSILLAGVVMTAQVCVGRHVVVMPNVTLTHDDVVADFATLCAGTSLGGSVRVGAAAYLGMNSSVREHAVVGAGATLGMGAVALADVPPGETWVGVPARRLLSGGSR